MRTPLLRRPNTRRLVITGLLGTGALLAGPALASDSGVYGDVGLDVPASSSVAASNPSLVSTDLVSGAARTSIPFVLPAARGGAQPALSLSYDSSRSTSTRAAGVGWGLGLPSIARHNPWGGPQYNDPPEGQALDPTIEDRFELDGAPLVPVCHVPSGCSLQPGETLPSWVGREGWHYFRLQREGMFARFFWSKDHKQWRVQLKSGELMEFGVPSGATDDDGGLEVGSYSYDDNGRPQHRTGIYRWNLVQHVDAPTQANVGFNAVRYVWNKTTVGGHGISYLTDIYDTPPAISGQSSPLGSYAHHTHLTYEPHDYADVTAAPIWRIVPDRRLKTVDVTSMDMAGSQRRMLRRYHLAYQDGLGRYVDHHSFLQTVSLEGRCGDSDHVPIAEPLPDVTGCPQVPLAKLRYSPFFGYNKQPVTLQSDQPFRWFNTRLGGTASPQIIDLNGDGVPDFVQAGDRDHPQQDVFINVPFDRGYALKHTTGSVDLASRKYPATEQMLLSDAQTISVIGDWNRNGRVSVNWAFSSDPRAPDKAGAPLLYSPLLLANGTWRWSVDTGFDAVPSPGDKLVDVNGDGLVDLMHIEPLTGPPVGVGYGGVYFATKGPPKASNPFRVPVTFDTQGGAYSNQFADMNGDGLTDYVRVTHEGVAFYAGDGSGRFSQTVQAIPAPYSSIIPLEQVFLHDVNGDGYTDLVVVDTNLNGGQGSNDIVTVYANSNASQFLSRVSVDSRTIPDWDQSNGVQLNMKVSFADMNGDGIDDLVVQSGHGGRVSYIDFIAALPVQDPLYQAPRPGLLIGMGNQHGLETNITYESTVQLMLEAATRGQSWRFTSPQVADVVTAVSTGYTAGSPAQYEIHYQRYGYSEPAYDGWHRSFLGFRNVSVTHVGDGNSPSVTTHTTFFFDDGCQDLTKACTQPDDSPYTAVRGLSVLSELHDTTGQYLSSVHSQYQSQKLYAGMDGRDVYFAYGSVTDGFQYDTSPFVPGSETMPIADVVGTGNDPAPRNVSVRGSKRAHVVSTASTDVFGNRATTVDAGRKDLFASDTPIVHHNVYGAPPGDTTGWSFRITQSDTYGAGGAGARTFMMLYDAAGNLTEVHGRLSGSLPLIRSHETGAQTAGTPSNASADGEIVLVHRVFDANGNVTNVTGPGGSCQSIDYDPVYAQLAVAVRLHLGGCNSATNITKSIIYDRGLGIAKMMQSENGALATFLYDGFGRLIKSFAPSSVTPSMSEQEPSVVATYFDQDAPFVRTRMQVRVAPGQYHDGWTFTDAFGRTALTLSQADPSAGDGGQWVARGLPDRDAKGLVQRTYRPWFYSGDPAAIPLPEIVPPRRGATTVDGSINYDAFGRTTSIVRADGTVGAQFRYHEVSDDVYDAAHLPGPTKTAGLPVTYERDGHGRIVKVTRYLQKGVSDAVATQVAYLPTGEPSQITQSHTGGTDTVVRTMTYDSLGRMVDNLEPNTSQANSALGVTRGWRYAYDNAGRLVGTSDARGCGKNLFYDSLGRILAEDYSPCLASQAGYTQYMPGDPSGANSEVFYRYDAPEAGQAEAFGTLPTVYVGRLASVSDRGAHTRFGYDGRGRAIGAMRQLAKPGLVAASLGDRYTPWWYKTQTTYDEVGRAVAESTGADVAELLDANQQSVITRGYTARGLLTSVGGSYGSLLRSATYAADGLPTMQDYNNGVSITATYQYDALRRLQFYTLSHTQQGPWVSPSATYTPPTDPTTTLQGTLEAIGVAYDPVGNPLMISDLRPASEWPAGAQPVTRVMTYDDFYRLTDIAYYYPNGAGDPQVSPFAAEESAGRSAPAPRQVVPTRVQHQTFSFDWKGNTTATHDDLNAFYDRSLGDITNGEDIGKPNQLVHAHITSPGVIGHAPVANRPICPPGGCNPLTDYLNAYYDAAGNLSDLLVTRRGPCAAPSHQCTQRYVYEWDEVNQLAHARRWDQDSPGQEPYPQIPAALPAADLRYAYSQGARVLKATTLKSENGGAFNVPLYAAEIFGSLRLNHAHFDGTDYERTAVTETVYLGGVGRLVYPTSNVPAATSGGAPHVFLELGDPVLGSASVVVDRDTGELVERSTYQAFGQPDSDYRPERWASFREDYRFTGKEDDVEVGLTYFGARYYHAALGRWASADPLTIHGMGADLNPYAYVSGAPTAHTDSTGMNNDDGCLGAERCDVINMGDEFWTQMPGGFFFTGSSPAPTPNHSHDGLGSAPPPPPAVVATPTLGFDPSTVVGWRPPTFSTDIVPYIQEVNTGNTVDNYAAGALASVANLALRGVNTAGEAVHDGKRFLRSIGWSDADFDTANIMLWEINDTIESIQYAVQGARAYAGAAGAVEDVGVVSNAVANVIGPFCFSADTPVPTEEGARAIASIHVGDMVWSRDEGTGELALRLVTQVFITRDKPLVGVEIDFGDGAHETLRATSEHPFRVAGKGWIDAAKLAIGDELVTSNGELAHVVSGLSLSEKETVYNLEVDGFHTYFVGEHGVWVHNNCSREARLLGRALEAAGFAKPADAAAHHIVASKLGGAAAPAQAVLAKWGIGINDAVNGVWLPRYATSGNPGGAVVHASLHSNAYYQAVNEMLGQATTREEVLGVLETIRQKLLSGGGL